MARIHPIELVHLEVCLETHRRIPCLRMGTHQSIAFRSHPPYGLGSNVGDNVG
jgi:hypothetical protein